MSVIHLIGLNHRTAQVEIREKFALTEFTSPEKWPFLCHKRCISSVQDKLAVKESLILSTCNRVEMIVVYDGNYEDLLKVWCDVRHADINELRACMYHYQDEEAIRHLFRVASSLDSLVLGEPQILGQLKAAYRLSVQAGHAGLLINRLLHKAFSVAKRVRSETAVASSAVSISYAAVELAKRIFDDMSQNKALLLGAGEMAELAAMHLVNSGIKELKIVNRTLARAEELAQKIGGEAFPFDALEDCLVDTDIMISSTGAMEAIIHPELMQRVMQKRKKRPMFLIDIAMPRDIDPAVNHLDNVYVYDIDDLKEVVEENLANRKQEAAKAAQIVDEEVKAFEFWRGFLKLKPTILAIEEKGDKIAHEEVAKTLKNLEHMGIHSPELQDALEKMAHAIVKKCHHAPLEYLHNSYKHNNGEQNTATLRSILKLDE